MSKWKAPFFPCRENKICGYIKRKIAVGRTDYERRKYKYLKVSVG